MYIQSGDIVWVSGPWHVGLYPDITIFQNCGLKERPLEAKEQAEADLGYCGEPEVIDLPQEGTIDMILDLKRAQMQHEMCYKRFKHWNCLNHNFRHGVTVHRDCMRAVTILTQLAAFYFDQVLEYIITEI